MRARERGGWPEAARQLREPPGGPEVAAHNLRLAHELLVVAGALDARGIPFAVLKGLPLTERLFGRLDRRRLADNDVLVRGRDAERARAALLDLGYANPFPVPPLRTALRRTNQEPLTRTLPDGVPVVTELHWSAVHPEHGGLDEDLQWAHLVPRPFLDRTVLVFDEPMTLLHLAAHFTHHDFGQPRILRELAIAWNAWASELDERALVRLARESGLVHVLAYSLGCAERLGWLETPPPALPSRRARLLGARFPAEQMPASDAATDRYRRKLVAATLVGPLRVPWYVLRRVFPSLETMAVIAGRPVSRRLWWNYLTRPVVLLRRSRRGGR